jgi:hypothetical protein
MIRIHRSLLAPTSLSTPEIQAYLSDLQDYLAAIEASGGIDGETTLKCPKPPAAYRKSDLLDKFETDFMCKCYLTEEKFSNGAALEVDHFIPKGEAPHLLYDWENLFPIASLANRMRPKRIPPGGYLNPCDVAHDVENAILYIFDPSEDHIGFEASDRENLAAVNTAELLDRLHNGKGETERSTRELRAAIRKQYLKITDHFAAHERPVNDQERRIAGNLLKKYFSRSAAFTMLMRNSPIGQRLQEFHEK